MLFVGIKMLGELHNCDDALMLPVSSISANRVARPGSTTLWKSLLFTVCSYLATNIIVVAFIYPDD